MSSKLVTSSVTMDADAAARDRIVKDINENFFVEAGAGSGKTTKLVERMVAMVEQGIPISEICAITFTKAAAGEFYRRFQAELSKKSATSKSCEVALQNIDLCFMGTIDSFCQMLLAEHPYEAGLPATTTIVSDEACLRLYKEFFFKAARGEHGPALEAGVKQYRAQHSGGVAAFANSMLLLMKNRNVDFSFHRHPVKAFEEEFAATKRELLELIDFLLANQGTLQEAKPLATNAAAWAGLPGLRNTCSLDWDQNTTDIIEGLNGFKKIQLVKSSLSLGNALVGKYFMDPKLKKPVLKVSDSVKNITQDMDNLLKANKKSQDFNAKAEKYEQTMDFFHQCMEKMAEVMAQAGKMSYFEFLYRLKLLLKEDAAHNQGKLIGYINKRHRYFLIDEFQDTNPMQAEIFFHLASDKPMEDWRACVPRKGSLFIVGDPKQSIYRFRSADVASFLQVKALFKGAVGDVLTMTRNYRSTDKLCRFFNEVFSDLLQTSAFQSAFEPIPAIDARISTACSEVYFYATEKEQDAEAIGKLINTLVNNDKYLIQPRDKAPRKITYKDIMVITTTKPALKPIIQNLAASKIPYKVEGLVPFDQNKALKEIVKLYQVLAGARDKLALYGALNGALLQCSNQDIWEYKAAGGTFSLKDKNAYAKAGAQRVAAALNKLGELAAEARLMLPSELFVHIMEQQIFTKVSADNLEQVYYALELLRAAEQSGEVNSLAKGKDFLLRLIQGTSGQERCLNLDVDSNRVHLANLHKVKGLQAPVVILPAAGPGEVTKYLHIVHGNAGPKGYYFTEDKINSSNRVNKLEYKAEGEAQLAEKNRLVYVAATRAGDILIISNHHKATGDTEEVSFWHSLLEKTTKEFPLEVRSQVQPKSISAQNCYDEAQKSCALKDKQSELGSYQLDKPSDTKHTSKLSSGSANPEGRSASSIIVHNNATLFGTMAHRLMELLVLSRNSLKVAEVVNQVISEYMEERYRAEEAAYREVLDKIANTIKQGGYPQGNGAPQDILNEVLKADEVYCEVPFSYKEEIGGEIHLYNGIIDLLYCKNGKWHIVDYKTNLDGSNLDTTYQGQLNAYIKAFKEINGLTADARIYHIAE